MVFVSDDPDKIFCMGFKRFSAAFFLLFGIHSIISAQEFGGDPPATHWQQINSDTARIIFPAGWDSIAQRIAAGTSRLQRSYSGSIGGKLKKIDIVLQKDATVSNAFVALGPYRSEYFLMPPQNVFELGAQSWTDNLMIHEYRHVQQYNNFDVGLSKAMGVLFGENGRALANAAAVPDWFFEGDAVYNETLLSEQGRGRLPFFFHKYSSLYFDNRHYNFMELRNGSLRHYIPGHYELGYLLVSYGRERYGDDFWKNVTGDAAAFRSLFYPMQAAVKKYSGIPYDRFVQDALAYYENQWRNEPRETAHWLTATVKGTVVDYKFPYAAGDGSWIVLKQSYRQVPAIYRGDRGGKWSRIVTRDISYDNYFSYNSGKLVYASYEADRRWGNRDFSVITLVDAGTGAATTITSHTKYFSPDISHNGSRIVAVQIKDHLQSELVLLNTSGRILKSFSAPGDLVYSYPKFSKDDSHIFVCARNARGHMALEAIDTADGAIDTLMSFANRVIGFPVVQGDTVLYSCSNSGRDEIWAYVAVDRRNFRVAGYQTGLYQAAFAGKDSVMAAAFTADGFRLGNFKTSWQPVEISDTLVPLYIPSISRPADNMVLESMQMTDYPVKKYPKLTHPFHFHSWSPYLDYPDFSFTIFGQNVLNTVQSQLYYTYNSDERYHQVGYSGIYGGWYLQPFVDFHQTFNRSGVADSVTVRWDEFNASAGLRLPLNFSEGRQYRYLTISGTYNINTVQWRSDTKKLLNNIDYAYLKVAYVGEIQKAPAQIFPHWAQRLSLQYRGSVTAITARQLLASGNIYLPGLFPTHSLVLDGAYQGRDTAGKYLFTNNFPFSRGYDAFNFPRMWKVGVNYHFPLVYPDWGFGNIVYFLRVRANLFYDYTNVKSLRYGYQLQFRSYGTEVYFDTRWWNQQPVTIGIRYSRLVDVGYTELQPNRWEIVLPVLLY